MATKPTASDASWGTDALFSSGPESGNPVKDAPSAGVKAQGWRPGDALGYVGAWFNFWMNQVYLWILYLSDLHNSVDFLNKTYAWVAAHTWVVANGSQAVSVTQSTGGAHAIACSASGGGDALRATSGHARVQSGNVIVESGTVSATGNISSGGEFVYPASKTRTKRIPLVFPPNNASNWVYQQGTIGARTSTTNDILDIPFSLPDGAIVTAMRVSAFLSDNAASDGLRVSLFSYRADKSGPYGPNTQNTGGALAAVAFTTASTSQAEGSFAEDNTVTAHGHNAALDEYVLTLISCDTITISNDVRWIDVDYSLLKPPDR